MRLFAVCLLIAIILVVILTSCYNQRKATQQFAKAAIAYPKILAQSCAITYPVKDSTIRDTLLTTDTILIWGQDITDTVRSLDTILITTIKYLPGKVITNTFHIIDTIYQENIAALKACQLDNSTMMDLLSAKTKEADKYHAQAKKRGLIMWSTFGVIFLILGLYFYFKSKKINV